jgi:hypothetical protein
MMDMAVSFIAIFAAAFMLMVMFAVVALIAIVAKRPGIAAVVGLVLLLGIGTLFGSLFMVRSYSHHQVHDGDSTLTTQFSDAHSSIHGIHGGRDLQLNVDFSLVKLLMVGAVVVGIAVALTSKGKHGAPGQRRSNWWPALLLVPLIVLSVLIGGSFVRYRAFAPSVVVPHDHSHLELRHGPHGPFQIASDNVARAHSQAAEQLERETNRRVAATNRARAEELRAETMYQAAALNEQLRKQIATMDIDRLIEIFQAPKIKLSTSTKEALAPVLAAAGGVPTPPVAAIAMAAAAIGEKSQDKVEAESNDKPTGAAVENATAAQDEGTNQSAVGDAAVAEVELPNAEENATEDPAAAPPDSENEREKDEDVVDAPKESSALAEEPPPALTPLPEWADDEPGPYMPNAWREIIVTDEYASKDECRRASDVYLLMKTADRVGSFAQHPLYETNRPPLTFERGLIMADGHIIFDSQNPGYSSDGRLRLLDRMGIGIEHVRRSTVHGQHVASRMSPRTFGTMYKQYTQVVFTPEFDNELRRAWNNCRRLERFEMVGGGAASVLGLLGLVFGLLKVDTWTKGYYTKRLFIGVPAVIIGGFAFLMLIAIVFE